MSSHYAKQTCNATEKAFHAVHSKSLNGCGLNILCLNPFKTEFLIMGLPHQIKKITDPVIHLSDNSSSQAAFTSNASVIPRISLKIEVSSLQKHIS